MRLFAVLVCVLGLAACVSTKQIAESLDDRTNAGLCPTAGSVYDASRYVKFVSGEGQLYTDIEYTGEIADVRTFCRYAGNDPVIASVEVDFAFGKGAKAAATSHTYPYFVAVTRAKSGKVLAKDRFAVAADFRRSALDGRTEVFSRIEIPRVDESISGENFEILVGFELTPEQLEFNRAGKRFRLGAETR